MPYCKISMKKFGGRENENLGTSILEGLITVVRSGSFNRNGAARAPVARNGGDPHADEN